MHRDLFVFFYSSCLVLVILLGSFSVCAVSVVEPDVVFKSRGDSKAIEEIFDHQKKIMLERLNNLNHQRRTIEWLTENPGTQLTGSFNPIIEEPEKWYGEYYLA